MRRQSWLFACWLRRRLARGAKLTIVGVLIGAAVYWPKVSLRLRRS